MPLRPIPHSNLKVIPCFLGMLVAFGVALNGVNATAAAADSGLFPTARIANLKAEKEAIAEELKDLPPREIKVSHGFYGYHSALLPVDPEADRPERRIDFHLQRKKSQPIHTIALMPAHNSKLGGGESYGFPKRFRIELRDDPNSPPLKTFDFSQEDYPAPDITPLILSDIDTAANIVRIAVTKGVIDDGLEYFALGEVYIITENRDGKLTNVAHYARRQITDGFESPPSWSETFMVDRLSALNMPLGSQRKENTDFVSIFPIQDQENPIEVVIDLGEPQQVGRVAFFPAKGPWEISLPHFGYPGTIRIDGFTTNDFAQEPVATREIVDSWDNIKSMILGDIFFAVPLRGRDIRYVRFLFSDLPMHGDSKVLAIGEISVFEQGTLLSHNQPVSISGTLSEDADPSLLVDNFAFNQEILPPEEWLKGVSKRYELEKKTEAIDAELAVLVRRLERNRNILIATILVLISGVAVVLYLISRINHSKELKRIRTQISSDLHDDVGSSIGALTLGLERLRNHSHSEAVSNLTQDLRLIAKEAAVALREAVWLNDQNSISLHELAQMMKDRAYFILGKSRVLFETEANLPDLQISLIQKRNLLLLFKEAMHNYVKHAGADMLFIALRKDDQGNILLELKDEGVGFTLSQAKGQGWGLSTMSKRASQLGGVLNISSQEGIGTNLSLNIPLSAFNKQ